METIFFNYSIIFFRYLSVLNQHETNSKGLANYIFCIACNSLRNGGYAISKSVSEG